jgi:hypothetical protein
MAFFEAALLDLDEESVPFLYQLLLILDSSFVS